MTPLLVLLLEITTLQDWFLSDRNLNGTYNIRTHKQIEFLIQIRGHFTGTERKKRCAHVVWMPLWSGGSLNPFPHFLRKVYEFLGKVITLREACILVSLKKNIFKVRRKRSSPTQNRTQRWYIVVVNNSTFCKKQNQRRSSKKFWDLKKMNTIVYSGTQRTRNTIPSAKNYFCSKTKVKGLSTIKLG